MSSPRHRSSRGARSGSNLLRRWARDDEILPPAPGLRGRPRPTSRGAWLLVAVALHAGALGVWLGLLRSDAEPEPAPIPIALLPEPPPEAEPAGEILHFRKPTHPRVRETLALPRRVQALAPPPPDALLDIAGGPGGFALEPVAHPSLGGFDVGGAGGGLAFSGVGRGNAATPGGSFEQYVGGLQQIGLDVVFVIDATGSMGWLVAEVKGRVRSLAAWLREMVPLTRFGVVAYRDDDDPEFATRVEPLTLSVAKVHRFLDRLEARGGGDIPEAVHAGLEAAIERAGWKSDSRKVIVILGDAPPHPEHMEQTLALARRFRANGGTVSLIDVSFDANPEIAARRLGVGVDELQTLERRGVLPEFRAVAEAGGGDAATLQGDNRVVRQLALLIFGRSWAEAVQPLLGEL